MMIAALRMLSVSAVAVAALACSPPPRPPITNDAATDSPSAVDSADAPDSTNATNDADSGSDASASLADSATLDSATADSATRDAGAPLRVLFVGNSYTYVNDLPAMLVSMTRGSSADALAVDSVTVGGATLQLHWQMTGARTRLEAGGIDAVVLQGQSVEPLFQPTVFGRYADELGALARRTSVRSLWFATWARRAGDAVYGESFSGGTPEAMTRGLEREYAAASMRNGGALVRVGEAWRRAIAERPSLALHSEDGSHPTVAGTYLAACVFYAALFGHPVDERAEVPSGVSADDARALRAIAAALHAER
ncbi:MAG: hypothetical protein JNK05_08650 [Myxococcales bacterium]|nr:hypothetical protein [Myxococcales bacterium]